MEKLTKKEKYAFGLLSAIFLAPEVIWGIISKYYFFSVFGSWEQMKEQVAFFRDTANASLYFNILFIQVVSIFILLVLTFTKRKKIKHYLLTSGVLLVLFLASLFVSLAGYFVAYGKITLTGMP